MAINFRCAAIALGLETEVLAKTLDDRANSWQNPDFSIRRDRFERSIQGDRRNGEGRSQENRG